MQTMTLLTDDRFTETTNSELHEMFLAELSNMLDAEKQLTDVLPNVAETTMSEELQSALESHLVDT